ncbi:MAG TPA: hypothetical protein VKD67_01015 [Acidimicrobiales bacterium]|nr:hypothetical protein [Acidimicrobiales bacterium]
MPEPSIQVRLTEVELVELERALRWRLTMLTAVEQSDELELELALLVGIALPPDLDEYRGRRREEAAVVESALDTLRAARSRLGEIRPPR